MEYDEAVSGVKPYSTDSSTVLLLKGNGKTLRGLRRAAVHFSKIFLAEVQNGGAGMEAGR